jgi:hypothetical protein
MNMSEKIRGYLVEKGLYWATYEDAAKSLNSYRTSIWYWLDKEGTSYSKLLHERRLELLEGIEGDPQEKAYLMGFTNPQAFYRWKRNNDIVRH